MACGGDNVVEAQVHLVDFQQAQFRLLQLLVLRLLCVVLTRTNRLELWTAWALRLFLLRSIFLCRVQVCRLRQLRLRHLVLLLPQGILHFPDL